MFSPPLTTVRLDPALRAHHPAIEALAVAAFADRGAYRRVVQALLADPDVWPVVARNGSELLGFFALYFERDAHGVVAWLPTIAVAPAARGRGLGAGLLGCAVRMAARGGAALGVHHLRLHVGARQAAAQALFAAAGFTPAGGGDGRYGAGGERALCLQRSLDHVAPSAGPERHLQIQARRRPDAGPTNPDTGAA